MDFLKIILFVKQNNDKVLHKLLESCQIGFQGPYKDLLTNQYSLLSKQNKLYIIQ